MSSNIFNIRPAATPTQSPSHEPIPEAYVVWRQTRHCKGCNTISETSELYTQYKLKSYWGMSKASGFKPLTTDPQYNLPIETRTKPLLTVPFCHACFSATDLSSLPRPPAQDEGRILNGLAGTETTEGSGATSIVHGRDSKPSRRFTIDDL